MAKKKDELTYGQMPLPQAQGSYTRLKVNWSGLNRRQTVDTGTLSMENNISTAEAPYLTPSQKPYELEQRYQNPISMFGFDGFIVVVYRDGKELKIDYIELSDSGRRIKQVHTGYVTQKDDDGNITKSAVDESTDYIQRSMVQFNVYENAADVLDGVYVKKLLLFPDKVSMFMNIVTVNDEDDMTDIDVMYYCTNDNCYYTYQIDDDGNGEFKIQPHSGEGYFMTDALDVVVKEYYNDGYALSTEKTYNDGYKKTESKYFNYDGYKLTNDTTFNDGYQEVTSGSYDSSDNTAYYYRSGSYSPYIYTRAVLNEGDSLAGLYRQLPVGANRTIKTYYARSGNEYPYEYTEVSNLKYNSSLSGYYEKKGDTRYPYTKNLKYYRRVEDKVPYQYTEVSEAELTYGKHISSFYEKISDKDIETVGYYKRNGDNDYTAVTNLDYGSNVSKLYVKTENYAPPEGSNKNCYWRNTFTNVCYGYIEDDEGNKGFEVALPPAFPNLKYAAVHLSRLFGVDEDRVHVSGFNDYANWNLDTVTETNESNAWSSAAQANTKANGEFTGITVYDNHVVCFKRDFMHEIYNNKNPFRLVDVYAEGSIDNRSIQEVDGKLIFVSEDEVKVYTGGNPRIIGYYLGIDKFTAAVSGSDGRNYYLYCEDDKFNKYLFVYDTFVEQWSQRAISDEVKNFAHNKNGMYMLTDKGIIYKLDTGKYNHDWSFETDMSTSLTASLSSSYPTVSVKHISKLQMFAYIPKDSSMNIYALYDSEEYIKGEDKDWNDNNKAHLLWSSDGRSGMIPIRLKPRMTANYGFKLHFEGSGYVRLYEMELRTTAGGELFRDR